MVDNYLLVVGKRIEKQVISNKTWKRWAEGEYVTKKVQNYLESTSAACVLKPICCSDTVMTSVGCGLS